MVDKDHDDLRATAESIAVDAEKLKALELRKLELEPADSATRVLSEQAEALATDIAAKAKEEKRLVEQIAEGSSPD